MKKIVIIAAIIILNAFADSDLSAVLEKYTNSPTEIDFERKTYWAVREKETKVKGKIIIGRNNKFNISVGKMSYVSNGDAFWEYNSRQKQVKVQKVTPQLSEFAPLELMNLLKTADFIENKPTKSFVWQNSKSLENGYEKVEIFLTNSQISKITVNDIDKNITTYIFEKTTFPTEISESLFNFVIPEGTQVYEN
ncbi:MAG: outer membrane lipoprotein carrier protein LolA [Chitinispirillales bacterium]|jgi:outer membrane lipoprotein-sorting protein|nr:outer membrane lipoprotein carrier protein LolA [Chitinispirillales bacterium]